MLSPSLYYTAHQALQDVWTTILRAVPWEQVWWPIAAKQGCDIATDLDVTSLGLSLTDTLDDLINEGRIEPQLAMKILSTFDRVVTEVLADKVRARLTFKVRCAA